MELTIVLAILAIIAAILIPTFLNTTDRARLRSDIQSAHVINNAMELYRATRGRVVAGANMDAMLANLHTAGYLQRLTADGTQTDGAVWELDDDSGRVVVNVTASSDSVKTAAGNLPDNERRYVRGHE